jgi:hypothetical protein
MQILTLQCVTQYGGLVTEDGCQMISTTHVVRTGSHMEKAVLEVLVSNSLEKRNQIKT